MSTAASATIHRTETLQASLDRLSAFLRQRLEDKAPTFELSPRPERLVALAEWFRLSDFEQKVLLLCAAVELDGAFSRLLPTGPRPDIAFALACFGDGHWDAFGPQSPLRYWRLLDVGRGETLVRRTLQIDERVLHFLLGIDQLDEQLEGFVESVGPEAPLLPSQAAVAEEIARALSRIEGRSPLVELLGPRGLPKRALAHRVARLLGLQLHALPVDVLPAGPHELDLLGRLWQREAALGASALLLDAQTAEEGERTHLSRLYRFAGATGGVLFIACRERLPFLRRPVLSFTPPAPTPDERKRRWKKALGAHAARLDGELERLAAQFDLSPQRIEAIPRQLDLEATPAQALPARLWQQCRLAARPRIGDLAHRIDSRAEWRDLVLPETQRRLLETIALHVRHRFQVDHRWGFGKKSGRGLGIAALFAGPSGTGKTLAAEVLANALQLDLYRIDLSRVVSKYIGETEKNLCRIFDAAEGSGAILLFDEADALFGKRSEVKDSHDRYANIEVSYLLQRMESYRGLAILTTNMKKALDTAFLRRIRFLVQFPFPDAAARAEIWRRIFPPETPTEGLDVQKLARLNLAGGNIRNIALNAAFLAAEAGEPVRMAHLLQAARIEYAKLEKSLTGTEIEGWL